MSKIPLGSLENPVKGVASPSGYEWTILGNWPDGHTEDILPQTDQAASQPTAEIQSVFQEKTEDRTFHILTPVL